MNNPIKITKGSTYIFVGKKAMTRNEYSKFKILEVTDTTYLIKNIDADRSFRIGIVDFNYDYKPVEVISSFYFTFKKFKKFMEEIGGAASYARRH